SFVICRPAICFSHLALDNPRVKIIESTGCTARDTVGVVQTKRKLALIAVAYRARRILKFSRKVFGAFLGSHLSRRRDTSLSDRKTTNSSTRLKSVCPCRRLASISLAAITPDSHVDAIILGEMDSHLHAAL